MSPVKRIALVSGELLQAEAATYAQHLVRGLVRAGSEVALLVSDRGGATGWAGASRAEEAGAKVHVIPRLLRPVAGVFARARAASRLRDFAPQVLHALSAEAYPAARSLGRRLPLGRGVPPGRGVTVPVVVTARRFVGEPRKGRRGRAFLGTGPPGGPLGRGGGDACPPAGGSPIVIASSEALRENLVNDGGLPKSRVVVVPFGLDLAAGGAGAGAQGAPAESGTGIASAGAAPVGVPGAGAGQGSSEAGAPAGPPVLGGGVPSETPGVPRGASSVVGCVSPLEPGAGMDAFLRAAGRVLGARDDVEFVVAGSGPAEQGLRLLAKELGVRKRLTFLGGGEAWGGEAWGGKAGGGEAAGRVLGGCDVLVLPGPRGEQSLTALRAMAAARPVVAFGAGGMLEVVRDGETGLLLRPEARAKPTPSDADGGRPQASRAEASLAEKMLRLLADGELRRELGRAGRELVENEFTLGAMVEGTMRVYERAVEEAACAKSNGKT